MYCIYLTKFKWNHYLLCYFLFNVIEGVLSKHKIAIIGAGIGGTSCAYFLHESLEDNVKIDIFEKSEIGGRLATVEYDSNEYETGGSIIHARNRYMYYFLRKFGLNQISTKSSGQIVIANGKNPIFQTSKWSIITMIKSFWRYRCAMFKIPYFVNKMLDSFDQIYDLQTEDISFKTVRELLEAMNPTFPIYQDINCHEGFTKHVDVNDNTISEFIGGTLMANYGQTVDVPMFVGAVSTSCAVSGVWSVEGGNKLIASHCLEESQAKLYKYKVNQIIRNKDKNIFEIEAQDDKKKITLEYDIVVIATPITKDMESRIEFINFQNPIKVKGRYHRTVATIVKGNLKSAVLYQTWIDDVSTIINLGEGELYFTISKITSVRESDSFNNDNIWKIFSHRKLTDNEIGYLFNNAEKIHVSDWLAYPQYEQLNRQDSFILDDNLYYINAIEWAASAMEMSVISAKNVALLIEKEITHMKVTLED